MKITFEGNSINEIIKQMDSMIEGLVDIASTVQAAQSPAVSAQGPGPEAAPAEKPRVDNSVDIFEDKPVEKPKEKAKPAPVKEKPKAPPAKKPVAAAPKKPVPPPPPPEEEEEAGDEDEAAETTPPVNDADLVQIRVKTTADLQAAYANGFQKEVFELLSRFGNGAKSFREVPADAFPAIREAIDNGALT